MAVVGGGVGDKYLRSWRRLFRRDRLRQTDTERFREYLVKSGVAWNPIKSSKKFPTISNRFVFFFCLVFSAEIQKERVEEVNSLLGPLPPIRVKEGRKKHLLFHV